MHGITRNENNVTDRWAFLLNVRRCQSVITTIRKRLLFTSTLRKVTDFGRQKSDRMDVCQGDTFYGPSVTIIHHAPLGSADRFFYQDK